MSMIFIQFRTAWVSTGALVLVTACGGDASDEIALAIAPV